MMPNRQSPFALPFLRMLLLLTIFWMLATSLWSVLIAAPFSLTGHVHRPGHSALAHCGRSYSILLEILCLRPGAGAAHMFPTRPSQAAGAAAPGDKFTSIPGSVIRRHPRAEALAMGTGVPFTSAAGLVEDVAISATKMDSSSQHEGRQAHGSSSWGDTNPSKEEVSLEVLLPAGVDVHVMGVLEELRSSGTPVSDRHATSDSCEGRWVHIYDLPTKFNAELVGNCDTLVPGLCHFFANRGMGEVSHNEALLPRGRWFQTLQDTLEVIFHARLLHYKCLTSDPALASLFYIPFYASLDVMHWNSAINATAQQKDQLSTQLVQWLDKQRWWHRKGGRDHVLVLGRATWDFRRHDNSPSSWGSYLLKFPAMQNLTKLLTERYTWHGNDIGVPYPTYFHPSSDEDIRVWQRLALDSPRRSLVSFAGMPRPDDPTNIRTRLIQQCNDKRNVTLCRVLSCHNHLCLKPEATMKLFLNSHFCMQPPGDTATRRSFFDSLIAGCIPVVFHPDSAYTQYPWHLPRNITSYSVYISQDEVRKGYVDVVRIVQQVPTEQVQEMRGRIVVEIMPQLLYAQPGASLSSFQDAFDISLRNMLNRVAKLEAAVHTRQSIAL